jgi:hypothetical protein
MGSRRLSIIPLLGVTIFALLQAIPYGRDRSTPPDGVHVEWSSPQAEQLAKRACYDCHSNQTRWPWYSAIAPASWRVQSHVQEGREALNFTAFDAGNEEVREAAGEASETLSKGEMPPSDYLLLHPEARLTEAEKATLTRALDVTFAAYAERGGRREGGRPGLTAGNAREEEERDEAEDDD